MMLLLFLNILEIKNPASIGRVNYYGSKINVGVDDFK